MNWKKYLLILLLITVTLTSCFAAATKEDKAVRKAQSYLRSSSFSYSGLIEQLEYSGFTPAEAKYGADKCGANWNEQAVKKAQSYLKYSSFSYNSLVEQLEFEGFTRSQAKYGVDHTSLGASKNGTSTTSSKEQAVKKATSYLRSSAFSKKGLIEQLQFEGFSEDDAYYAVRNCGADWNVQAAKCAKSYMRYSKMSYSDLKEQLLFEGFTSAQAEYGVNHYNSY
jgi:hypothetical protein